MSKITVFNKSTGVFMFSGDSKGSKVTSLAAQGHKVVGGIYGKYDKWDFMSRVVVPNTQAKTDDQTISDRKKMLRQRSRTNRDALVLTLGANRSMKQVNDAIDMLIEMQELP